MSEMLQDVLHNHELCFISRNWFLQELDSFIISLFVYVQKHAKDYSETELIFLNLSLKKSAAQCAEESP